ncbi:MAG: putative sulfate exporter family transporter, partial [Acutalibacteraceae bacterium]
GFALFAGTAVNDTSSVTAASSSYDGILGTGTKVLDSAVIVKLTRTLAIIPITLALAFYRMHKEKKASNEKGKMNFSFKKVFPFFILFFLGASVITTIISFLASSHTAVSGVSIFINDYIFSFLKWLSKFFIIMAMAAIGINTNIVKLVKTGGKPILLGFCCWVGITGVSLFMQHIMGLL